MHQNAEITAFRVGAPIVYLLLGHSDHFPDVDLFTIDSLNLCEGGWEGPIPPIFGRKGLFFCPEPPSSRFIAFPVTAEGEVSVCYLPRRGGSRGIACGWCSQLIALLPVAGHVGKL